MNKFAIILCLCLPIWSNAQDNSNPKKGSFLIGGKLNWNTTYQLKEFPQNKKTDIYLLGQWGFFISENDVLLIKPQIEIEKYTFLSSSNFESTTSIGCDLKYKRYFSNYFFGGVYLGGKNIRNVYRYSSNPTIDYDKQIYSGIEIGHFLILSQQVGIETSLFLSAGRIDIVRDFANQYYYTHIGINIGLLYILK
ncbi:MAG: hypothetical protein R2751_03295 [Bacteroidales bacterium]